MTSSRINAPVAIMFTDIVGYSSMIAKDEKGGLALLDEHNSLIFPLGEAGYIWPFSFGVIIYKFW